MKLTLGLLTVLHLLVDGICGAALAAYAIGEPNLEPIVFYFSLYTILAFGLQGPMGFVLDSIPRLLRTALLLALGLLGLGTVRVWGILIQVIFLGLGNCLFHVVGGYYVLCQYSTYKELGLFVAGGAIGLGLGLNSYVDSLALVIGATLLGIIAFFTLESPVLPRRVNAFKELECPLVKRWACGLVLLLCIVLRGFSSNTELLTSHVMLLPVVFAVGKLMGGIICDALGYKKTSLMIFILGFIGLQLRGLIPMLLFVLACNMTMPLTLRVAHWCIPTSPGLIFGLAASCLVPGALAHEVISFPPQLILVVQFISLALVGYCLLDKET